MPPGPRRGGVRAAATGWLVAASAGLGCLFGPDDARFEIDVGDVRVLGTAPADGSTGVPTDAVIDVCFDGILAPDIDPRAVQLLAGSALFDARAEVMLAAWRPPGAREGIATTRWCPGSVVRVTPISPLRPDTPYRIRLDTSVRGWSGERLLPEGDGWINDRGEPVLIVSFVTAPTRPPAPGALAPPATGPEASSEPTRLAELFAPGGPFDPSRDSCGCHRDAGPARDLLDLTSVERAATTLLRDDPERPLLPGRPDESRIIHVTLRDAAGEPLPGPRSGPMPPEGSDVEPWTHADLARVAAWIAAGAPP